jgi:nucleoside-diphosphate-sugar epimerase
MNGSERVLVTGADGFLGRPLCSLLQNQGYQVTGVDLRPSEGPWSEFRALDLTRTGACDGLCDGIDAVFHLAAKTHAVSRSPHEDQEYRQLNVDLTRHLVSAAAAAGVSRIVMMSSVKVMGEGGFSPQDEKALPQPDSAYGRTKWEAERLVLGAGSEQGIHTGVLRAPLIYGPGVKGNLHSLITAIKKQRFPPLPDTGNRRSLVDVRDVARALVLLAYHPGARGKTYLVTDGHWYSTQEMCNLIRAALGRGPVGRPIPDRVLKIVAGLGEGLRKVGLAFPFDRTMYHKMLGSACYSSRAIEKELGFRPEYTLDKSLPEMIV